MGTKSLYMSLGENAGKLIYDIALESLLFHHELGKCFEIFERTLHGIDRNLSKEIISGISYLGVCEDEASMYLTKDKLYDTYNLRDYYLEKMDSLLEKAKKINKASKGLDKFLRMQKDSVTIKIDWKYVLQGAYDDNLNAELKSKVLEEFAEEVELNNIQDVVRSLYAAVKQLENEISTCLFIKENFPELLSKEDRRYIPSEVSFAYTNFQIIVNHIKSDVEKYETFDKIKKHLEFIQSLKNISMIQPVNIRDKYDAGWLAPNGDYYGMNGDISNMIHIEIANKLLESGIINVEDDEGSDTYLDLNGWVRIHQDWILYSGYSMSKLDKENIPLTEEQLEKLVEYGNFCCEKSVLRLGLGKIPMSAARLEMTDKYQLHKYFDF